MGDVMEEGGRKEGRGAAQRCIQFRLMMKV